MPVPLIRDIGQARRDSAKPGEGPDPPPINYRELKWKAAKMDTSNFELGEGHGGQ